MTNLYCPICGTEKLLTYRGRLNGACANRECNSVERTRVIYSIFQKLDLLKPGLSVLHIAPDPALIKPFAQTFGKQYTLADIRKDAFAHLGDGVDKVAFDMTDIPPEIERRKFDIILHSHVLEHLRASWQLAFLRLTSLINPGGFHIFAIPILRDWSSEDLSTMSLEERALKFGQRDHMRYIGRRDFKVDIKSIKKLVDPVFFAGAGDVLSRSEMEAIAGDRDVFVLQKRGKPTRAAKLVKSIIQGR